MTERFDEKVIFSDLIHSAFRKVADNKTEDMEIHFVCAGDYYNDYDYGERLKSYILKGMKIYGINLFGQLYEYDGQLYEYV